MHNGYRTNEQHGFDMLVNLKTLKRGISLNGWLVMLPWLFNIQAQTAFAADLGDPAIPSQPASRRAELGQSVTFEAAVTGTPPLGFQWWKGGEPVAGATETSLVFTNIQMADAGFYSMVVSNVSGIVTSTLAELSVDLVAVDNGFTVTANGPVRALALQPDGKILLGGEFTMISGQQRYYLDRLNVDGTRDTNFNTLRADLWVYALALQENGRILIGGTGQYPSSRISRLNPDGTYDTTFNPVADGAVYTIAVQPDEKILIGGVFTTLNGEPNYRIARLNKDGTTDKTFNSYADRRVFSLVVQPDGKILTVGDFTWVADKGRRGIARLNPDGTLDEVFDPGWSDRTTSIALQADGKILLAGDFFQFSGQTRHCVARLHPNGTLDETFNSGEFGQVQTLAVQADGKILVGGSGLVFTGQQRDHLARLNEDGTLDSYFNPVIERSVHDGSTVQSLALQNDGKVVVGGLFNNLDGQTVQNIARLHNTSSATQNLNVRETNIAWLRGGSSPEVERVTFEVCRNVNSWTSLGEGSRIVGGWQLTGVTVPSDGALRARGFVRGGQNTGSSWFVETLRAPQAGMFFGARQVGSTMVLQIGGELGRQYDLEYAEALGETMTWSKLSSIFLANNPQSIQIESSTNLVQRFYRLKPVNK